MRSYITLIPGLLVTLYLITHFLRRSKYFWAHFEKSSKAPIAKSFIMVYLPIMLLLPHVFLANIPVLPNFSFSQSAIIPIFIAFLFIPEKKQMKVNVALVLLCSILLVTTLKLFYTGMKIPNKYKLNRSPAFTLLSIIIMLNITYLTVYMSHQLEALTFIIVGLSQGFLDTYPTKQPYIVNDTKKRSLIQTLAPA